MTSPGNLSLFECSVGLDKSDLEINLHWECQCSSGKRMGNSLEEVLAGDTTGDHESLQSVLTAQVLGALQHLPLGCTHSGTEQLLPPPCSGDKIPGKSVLGSLCSLEFSFRNEICQTRTPCSHFLQNPTGFTEVRTSFDTPYSHSFYLQPDFYPFISKGEHGFARASLFSFPREASPSP